MKRVVVFCGSSFGRRPAYREATERLGTLLAERGLGLVFGGRDVGLMGVVAEAVRSGGGEVIGVLPEMMRNARFDDVFRGELRFVPTLHERKRQMYELSDAAIALPGGIGTLVEEAVDEVVLRDLDPPRHSLDAFDQSGR